MEQLPTIYLIHASDAPQHEAKLLEIIQNLTAENRIQGFSTLAPDNEMASLKGSMLEKDLILVLLTNKLEPKKDEVENRIKDLAANRPGIEIAEILIDNVKYDNSYITFPVDLRPIRDREDMDATWSKIEENLKEMFPVQKNEEPVPFDWQKYLKIAIPVIIFVIAIFWWSPWERDSGTAISTNSRAVEEATEEFAFLFEIEDVFSITGRGTVVTGRISRGVINEGDEVVISGGEEEPMQTIVTSIQRSGNSIENASAGETVGLLLRGIDRSQVQNGMVIQKPR